MTRGRRTTALRGSGALLGLVVAGVGEEKTIECTVAEPGDRPFACSCHVQLGQVGTTTVRG